LALLVLTTSCPPSVATTKNVYSEMVSRSNGLNYLHISQRDKTSKTYFERKAIKNFRKCIFTFYKLE
jgi:hypothetical protein